uniref:Uncharacterized protein n=1 Tax=Anguilla anguilla TaxID=7936 RepID=A0A0E9R3J6_ANGAN
MLSVQDHPMTVDILACYNILLLPF